MVRVNIQSIILTDQKSFKLFVTMSPAKENDASSFPQPLAPPSSCMSSSLTPLSTMFTLPTSARPLHYDIQVSFHIPLRRYRGHVDTSLEIYRPSQMICVNSSNLDLENISMEGEDGRVIVGLVAETNTKIGVIRIDFGTPIPAGKYTFSMDFSGSIRNGLQGVYINRFTDKDGQEQDGVSTMFAATEARSFFPCWDQPDIKCTFQLRVLIQKGVHLDVLSNMNKVDEEKEKSQFVIGWGGGEWIEHKFAKSPLMSTYLLCIVIGQYSCMSKQVAGTIVSIHAPLNRGEEAKFALDTAVECILIFNKFFGINYCLPKLDLVGLACLSVGAMENWGLITYRF